MTGEYGQSVIVDNRPGGNTLIGAQAAATSAPDGYTLFLATDHTFEINPSLYERLPYDPIKDFIPVIKVIETGQAFMVPASLPVRTLKEFVELVRSQPGKHAYGSAGGSGSPSHLNMEKFRQEMNLQMTHVPYKGSAPALTELVSGRISAVIAGLGGGAALIKSEKLRALAIGTETRGKAWPDIPTFPEALGQPYDYMRNWMGFFVPAGTPKAIVDKLAADLKRSLGTTEIAAQIERQGFVTSGVTTDEFARGIQDGQRKWGAVIKSAGVKVE